MQKITLQELLSALLGQDVEAIDTSALGHLAERERIHNRHMDVYRKRVVDTSAKALDEFFVQCRTPGCTYVEHRTWPNSADDMLAIANLFVYVSNLYMDAAKRLGSDAFEVGKAVAEGEAPPTNYATEALFAVISSAMITATTLFRDTVANDTEVNALKFFSEFESKTRQIIADHSEMLLTGKPVTIKEGSSVKSCH